MKHSLFKIKALLVGFVALATLSGAASAATYDLVIDEKTINLAGFGEASDTSTQGFRRGSGDSMHVQGRATQHRKPPVEAWRERQPATREGQAGSFGVAGGP